MRIFKYQLALTDEQTVLMHGKTPRILSVQVQNNQVCVWAVVDEDAQLEPVEFRIYGTGNPVPADLHAMHHIGTVQLAGGGLVFHVFTTKAYV